MNVSEAKRAVPNSGTPEISSLETVVVVDGSHSGTPNEPLEAEGSIAGNGRKRLSGAARKRFRKLVANGGVAVEQALDMCRKPWKDIPVDKQRIDTLKRRRSEDKSLGEPINEAPTQSPGPNKKPRMFKILADTTRAEIRKSDLMSEKQVATPSQKSRIFKKIAEATRVGIRNSEPMSEEQMNLVHRHLILSITKLETAGDGPEFLGFSQKTGWILVTCANQDSRDWLANEISKLKPWPQAQLSIMADCELQKPATAITFLPKTEAASTAEAMTLLKVQNKGLNTGLWRVLNEKEEETGRIVTFSIDEQSVEALQARDYQAILGFRRIFFKIKGEQSLLDQPIVNTTHSVAGPTPSASGGQISDGSQSQGRPRVFRGGSWRGKGKGLLNLRMPQNPDARVRYTPQAGGSREVAPQVNK